MEDLILWLQHHIHEHSLLYFIALYVVGGRPVAVLTASVFRLNLFWFVPLVVFMDTLQIPCFYYLYEQAFKSDRLQRLSSHFKNRGNSVREGRLFRTLKGLRGAGVVLLTMLPIKGGGMWSGVFLAHIMGIPKRTSFTLLISGSILGSFMFVGLGDGFIRLYRLLA